MDKVGAVARILATLLAVVAAFVAIPSLDVGLVLVVLGLVAGLTYAADEAVRVFLLVLALPAIGAALNAIPMVGEQLGAIATNLGLAVAGVAAMVIARRLIENTKGDTNSLIGK